MAPPTESQPTPEQVAAYERLERARAAYRATMASNYWPPADASEGAKQQLARDAVDRELDAALLAWHAASRAAVQAPEAA